MNGYFMIEIVIRRNESKFKEIMDLYDSVKEYIVIESFDKIILNVPTDSIWFKNGMITELFRTIGDCVYVALAYFSTEDELVLDFKGQNIEPFEVSVNGKLAKKFVKKKIMIVNETETQLKVEGYIFNYKFSNPVVQVLSVYTLKSEVNFHGDEFTLVDVIEGMESR